MKRGSAPKASDPEREMDVAGHLRELRGRLFVCLGVLAVCMIGGIPCAPSLVRVLLRLGERYQYRFIYLSPEELLLEYLVVDFAVACCLTFPVLLYEVWAFLRQGLHPGERALVVATMLAGTFCAVLGILFAYGILLPFTLRFLISLQPGSGVQASISVRNYISFLLTMFMVFAAIFELPVAMLLLTRFGILKVKTMKRLRKAVIPLVFLVAAVITPPDVVSQIIVAIPLLALYELSILLGSLMESRRKC